MKIKIYLSFLTLCFIFSEGIGASFNTSSLKEDIDKSSNVLIRNKRVFDNAVASMIPTQLREFPYVVAIHKNGYFSCSGTILAAHIIISAAHCFMDSHAHHTVLSGSNNANYGNRHEVIRHMAHPNYTHGVLLHDVTLITIMPPIDLVHSPNRAIELSSQGNLESGLMAFVVGWGLSIQHGVKTHTGALLHVVATIMDEHECQVICDAPASLANLRICTGDKYGDANTSSGDSGGPLVLFNRLIGVISSTVTHSPSSKKRPDISTNLLNPLYGNWIKAFLRHHEFTLSQGSPRSNHNAHRNVH